VRATDAQVEAVERAMTELEPIGLERLMLSVREGGERATLDLAVGLRAMDDRAVEPLRGDLDLEVPARGRHAACGRSGGRPTRLASPLLRMTQPG
jgi:hypothetical protein